MATTVNNLKRPFAAILALAMVPCATPAVANDVCDDLWFSRNFEFYQAGYCFNSRLGRKIFGRGCSSALSTLSDAAQARVQRIRGRESELGCNVDSGRKGLDIFGLKTRLILTTQPVINIGESMCIGWRGGKKDLFGADLMRSNESVVGQLWDGDYVSFRHDDSNDLTFVQTYINTDNGLVFRAQGWTFIRDLHKNCDGLAG